jgi:hypothetical protein
VRASTWAPPLPCPGAGVHFVVVGLLDGAVDAVGEVGVGDMQIADGGGVGCNGHDRGVGACDTTAIATASSTTDADSVAAQFQLNITGLTVRTSYQLCAL